MALEDRIYVTTELDAAQVMNFFLRCMGIEEKVNLNQEVELDLNEGSENDNYTPVPGKFFAYALRIRAPRYSAHVTDRLGIVPSVELPLTLAKGGNREAIREEILIAIVKMLRETEWDLALLHGDSIVVLLRKSGQLMLKMDYPFWTPERLKMVDLPYTMKDIPRL